MDGRLAKDSSMMQGILLSLQSLMTTEVEVADSQFMTGENEYVKFGTFTLSEEVENTNVIVQYIVKSDQPGKLSRFEEQLVQELALSFCKFIILTPNFHQNLAAGRMIQKDEVSKAFLKACTIAKQKISVQSDKRGLLSTINKYIQIINEKPEEFETLTQLKNVRQWLGEDDSSWDKGAIVPFKRQLLVQMVAQDILNKIIVEDPFLILEYQVPRYITEEIRLVIEEHLKKLQIDPVELINRYLSKDLHKKVKTALRELSIDHIHSAKTFIANNLAKDIFYKMAKESPLHSLVDFRNIPLYSSIQERIGEFTEVPHPGTMICDALIDDTQPLVLQSARLFFNQLLKPFTGKKLPPSIWNVIINFTFSLIEEKPIKRGKKEKQQKNKTAIEVKRNLLKERLSKLSVIQPKWVKDLIDKFYTHGVGEQLQISNIEESVLFANALERAIISTLEKIVKDQLFNHNIGDIFIFMIKQFKSLAPKTVLMNVLSHIIRDIKNQGYETRQQMSLSARDLIAAAIEQGTIKTYVGTVPVQQKKFFFKESKLKFDGRIISSSELLQKPGLTFSIGNKMIPLRELEMSAEFLTTCLANSKILRRAYAKAILRGMISTYFQQMFQFEGQVINQLDILITVFNREMVGKLNPAHRLKEIQENFPTFPLIRNVPERFKGKNFHDRCQESWNNYAPKIHKTIQDLLSGFSTLRTKDLNYKKKAMKLYSKTIKELKNIKKNLLKNWEPLNNQMTKLVENWSKDVSINLTPHLDRVRKNFSKWVGDEFKIQKLEYGRFTLTYEQAQKAIKEMIRQHISKEMEDLPKNFIEIAISILLYRRIPDYVIDESYNQMISGERKVTDTVLKAWSKSKSRTDFERNLYLNMRVLSNTFTRIINIYGRLISTLFVENDIELASDIRGYYIRLGLLPMEVYATKTDVLSILKFPNVHVTASGKDWEVRLYLEPEYKKEMDKYRDRLIVMSDIIRFVARKKFDEYTSPILEGLKAVIPYLIQHGDTNIIDLAETIKEALFRLSEYPTKIVEEKKS
ncbi:MAG: hypothetical protein ACTSRO_06465 [Candidatus Heimdallarchaeaceae archaeon]